MLSSMYLIVHICYVIVHVILHVIVHITKLSSMLSFIFLTVPIPIPIPIPKPLHFTSKKLYFVIITVHNISLKNIFKKTQSYMVYDNFLGEPAERVFIFLINPLPHPVHPRPPAFI